LAEASPNAEIRDEAIFWLAQYDFFAGNSVLAEKQFILLARNSDNNYFKCLAYYWLGKIACIKGEREGGLKFFELASNLSTTNELRLKINFEKADIFLQLAEFDKALNIYVHIINNYPESNFALLSRKKKADIQLSRGELLLARQNYREALTEVKSDFNACIQFQIAKTYLNENKLIEALSEFFNVVYLYPDIAFWKERALLQAADIYHGQGKLEEAKRIYLELAQSKAEISQLAKKKLEIFRE